MARVFVAANAAISNLGASLAAGATTLVLREGDGVRFPTLGVEEQFALTIGGAVANEIVYVIARTGDVCTVERAQEGTVEQSWPAGSVVQNLMTAGQLGFVSDQLKLLGAGRAVVSTPGRTGYTAPIAAPIVTIRNAFQTPAASTVTLKTDRHGWAESAAVKVRIEGWHGATKRAHPAWGDWSAITIVDETTLIVDGSIWADGSMFRDGYLWRADDVLIDARPELQALLDMIGEDGRGRLLLPSGTMPILTQHPSSTPASPLALVFPDRCTVVGQGDRASVFFAGDGLNAHLMALKGTGFLNISQMGAFGNRAAQSPSIHAHILRIGETGHVSERNQIHNNRFTSSNGYFIALQLGSLRYAEIFGNEFDSSYVDTLDTKNRDFGNLSNSVHDNDLFNFALGLIGTNYPPTTLGTDPFTTEDGSSEVTVESKGQNLFVGNTVTYGNAPTNFNGIDFNRSVQVTAIVDNDHYKVSFTGQQANATSTGGGSGVLEYVSTFKEQKAGIDVRGDFWTIYANYIESDMNAMAGVRLRKGGSVNGPGAQFSNVWDTEVINTGPVVGGHAVADIGLFNNIAMVTAQRCLTAARVTPPSVNCTLTHINSFDCKHNTYVDGSDTVVMASVSHGAEDAYVADGDSEPVFIELPEDPFSTIKDSDVISVHAPDHGQPIGVQALTGASWAGNEATFTTAIVHGIGERVAVLIEGVVPSGYNGTYVTLEGTAGTTIVVEKVGDPGLYVSGGTVRAGATLRVANAERFNSAHLNGPNFSINTVPDADHFTYVSDVADTTATGGGEFAEYSLTNVPNNATNVTFTGCSSFEHTVSACRTKPNARSTSFFNCESRSDVPGARDLINFGQDTIVDGPFGKVNPVVTIALDGAGVPIPYQMTLRDTRRIIIVPSGATSQAVIIMPPFTQELLGAGTFRVLNRAPDGIGVRIEGNGLSVRIGAVSATVVRSTQRGATVALDCVADSLWMAESFAMTWTV